MGGNTTALNKPRWYRETKKYERPELRKALWQIANTMAPYLLLCYLMYRNIESGRPFWLNIPLAVVAAGLLVRIFIIFHDCAHKSFFAASRANTVLGYICGVLTFTAYEDWRRLHGIHHNTVGDLDRRGHGDVWTMTVGEYMAAPRGRRLAYRLFRNPVIMFGVGPLYMFLVSQRFYSKGAGRLQRRSVYLTDAILVAVIAIAGLTIGLKNYVLIQLPVIWLAGSAGVWLFYVQHQFEGVYWSRHQKWDSLRAALEGSSCYLLPGGLRWFTGHIGLHHVHHIRPRIANYNLQRCYDETASLKAVRSLNIRGSLKSMRLKLWDEKRRKLVGFNPDVS